MWRHNLITQFVLFLSKRTFWIVVESRQHITKQTRVWPWAASFSALSADIVLNKVPWPYPTVWSWITSTVKSDYIRINISSLLAKYKSEYKISMRYVSVVPTYLQKNTLLALHQAPPLQQILIIIKCKNYSLCTKSKVEKHKYIIRESNNNSK